MCIRDRPPGARDARACRAGHFECFTMVREPVARVISYFYERIYGGVYKHTRTLNDLSVDEAEAVLRDFHFGRERGVNVTSPGAAAARARGGIGRSRRRAAARARARGGRARRDARARRRR